MKRKRLRIVSVMVLLSIIAAIPASTQVLHGTNGEGEASNLPLLVAVNKMGLTAEQMQEIHDLLEGLLEKREALQARLKTFEAEMIEFSGTAEELDVLLEAFRAETAEQAEAARAQAESVMEEIKGILTLKQGEILAELIPGFLGDFSVAGSAQRGTWKLEMRGGRLGSLQDFSNQEEPTDDMMLRDRVFEQVEERLADHPEFAEQLQQRLDGMMSRGGFPGGMQGQGMFGMRGGRMSRGTGFSQRFGVFGGQMTQRSPGWIEQLVEVLELKLEAIE